MSTHSGSHALEMHVLLSKYKVRVRYLENHVELDSPESKILHYLMMILPEVDNDRRSLNTKRGMRQAKREGRWNGKAPTGFKLFKENGICTLTPNEKAKYINESFKLFSKGIYSKEHVRRLMKEKGFKLSKNAFSTMLSNPVYIGKIKIKAWKDEPEEIVDGIHEGVVTEKVFNDVQSIIKNKRVQPLQKTTKNPHLPLRGYLVCSKCGGNITGSKSKGNGGSYYYYHCQKGCKERFNALEANTLFEEHLNSFAIPDQIGQLYIAIMQDLFKEDDKQFLKETNSLNNQIEKVKERLISTDDKFIDRDLDASSYKQIKERFTSQKIDLEFKLTRLKGRKTNFKKYYDYCIPLISEIGKTFKESSLEIKQKIISSIFPEKLIYKDQIYRTTKPSVLLSLFTLNINDLGELKKDVQTVLSETSLKAPPQGLEPWTY
jgi:hypothetical protein